MGDQLTDADAAALEAAIKAVPPIKDGNYQLTMELLEGCLVMRLTGLVLQPISDEFQLRVERLFQQGAGRRVILDLSGCSYVSSSVIGILIRFFNLGQDRSGQMLVVRPPERVEKVMRAVGLDAFFLFVDSLEMALGFFKNQKR